MKIGIISEGHSDRAVIANILIGVTGMDISNIEALLPIYSVDETDKALTAHLTNSTWSKVKNACEKRELIDGFLAFDGQDFVVIHLDTAEADLYGTKRPNKNNVSYSQELRELVIQQINSWLKNDLSEVILYAVAIEEIDAWVLPIFEKNDSAKAAKPKERLAYVLGRKGVNSKPDFANFYELSKPLSKPKEIKRGKYLSYNYSLSAFFHEVEIKVLPKL